MGLDRYDDDAEDGEEDLESDAPKHRARTPRNIAVRESVPSVDSSLDRFIEKANEKLVDVSGFQKPTKEQELQKEVDKLEARVAELMDKLADADGRAVVKRKSSLPAIVVAFAFGCGSAMLGMFAMSKYMPKQETAATAQTPAPTPAPQPTATPIETAPTETAPAPTNTATNTATAPTNTATTPTNTATAPTNTAPTNTATTDTAPTDTAAAAAETSPAVEAATTTKATTKTTAKTAAKNVPPPKRTPKRTTTTTAPAKQTTPTPPPAEQGSGKDLFNPF